MTGPRVLTFNFHEPYLCLMAKTGLDFTVGLYDDPPLARAWQTQFRPIPPNMRFMPERAWREELAAGKFDVVVAHNESNALTLLEYDVPRLLVCHNRKTFLRTTVTGPQPNPAELIEKLLDRLRQDFGFICISESKRADYGIPGTVILPGIDVEEYGGYSGDTPEVLRVGNMMRARNLMFDVDFQEQVCAGIRNRVVGGDPAMPEARESGSFEDLLHLYRSRRCLLHVTREEYEDGYNLALLEAMACGMPVVSLANRTSPITDGVDGFASYDASVLRGHVLELLNDLELARAIGARGRETVARKFPIAAFTENWRRAIEEAAERGRRSPRTASSEKARPLNLLMHYVASPFTTGRYFEQAARKKHRVVTAGFRCPEEVLVGWGFSQPPPYPPHDVELPLQGACRQILDRLPPSFQPNVYLWIDSGEKAAPPDIDELGIPKVCYLIDTHIDPNTRIEIARHFDWVFLAQKAQVDVFRQAGIRNVQWLPLACSPDLHNVEPLPRIYDVAYVGGFDGDPTDRRRALLQRVRERFPNSRIGRFWPDEMVRIYAQSKLVVNACVNRDVNMRVFEGLASGALLITDQADGLEDLFEDGKHLIVYRNDNDLVGLLERYLGDDAARERIAAAGSALVRDRHTYERRLDDMLDAVTGGGVVGESRFQPGGYYRNTRPEIAQFVPLSVRRLLDVGCGGGDFGKGLKDRGVKEVHGIEIVERACESAKRVLDSALLGNIEEMELPFAEGYFDCITFADVLEHLVDSTPVLRKVQRVLAPDGTIIMSIPNVRFYAVIDMLIGGRWQYTDAGILDRTHLRFFTAIEMRQMVEDAGLEVLHLQALSCAPDAWLPRQRDGSVQLSRASIRPANEADYRDLLTYQYVVIAGKPNADRLAKARDALRVRENEAAKILAEQALGVDECERRTIMAAATARMGQLTEAEELYRAALRLRPEDTAAMAELGIVLVAMNRAADAKPLLERAVARDPQHHRATGALGLVYVTEGRALEAVGLLEAALDGSFENKALLPHLLQAAEQLDCLARIEELVRRYADFYPGDADIGYAYAALLARLNRQEEARDRLETLLLLSPSHQAAQDLLREIGGEAQ